MNAVIGEASIRPPHWAWGAEGMSTNVVNLDALIPRQDFAVDDAPPRVTPLDKISIAHLDGHYFAADLRKPDFQRETVHWTPAKVVDLVRSFVDADLIPAVILWRAGRYIFVIDGAHRLSALLAWIVDDYGDRKRSLDFSGGFITDEQRRVATRTRDLIQKTVGTYAEYQAFRNNRDAASTQMQKRLSILADNALVAQWVAATDAGSAQESFFKINQQGTPIDPTERRLLKSRDSASAIAARAITHAGSGHKYWGKFPAENQRLIENYSKELYHSMYDPPIQEGVVTTLDVPVAGRGYNALPFIFDLVNQSNDVKVADTTKKGDVKDALPPDTNGDLTVTFLKGVQRRVNRITGDQAQSLGLHPVVYFYTRSGAFQPATLLATSTFVEGLALRRMLAKFCAHRREFEEFLVARKEATSLLFHKFGSGDRSIPWVTRYYDKVLRGLMDGKGSAEIQAAFALDPDFAFLTVPRPSGARPESTKQKRSFNSGTKNAAFFAGALPNGTRCTICGALVHRNAVQIDHIVARRDLGGADASNAQISHPYCNSIKEQLLSLRREVDSALAAKDAS